MHKPDCSAGGVTTQIQPSTALAKTTGWYIHKSQLICTYNKYTRSNSQKHHITSTNIIYTHLLLGSLGTGATGIGRKQNRAGAELALESVKVARGL